MINKSAQRIKNYLEAFYDIPFDVDWALQSGEASFKIKPHNNDKALFCVDLTFKNNVRLIAEVTPEKFAAFSIQDMAKASNEKKKMFAEYARQLQEKKAKTEFFINNSPHNATKPNDWPDEWQSYSLRVTRSPICSEDEVFDEADIASSWAAMVVGMMLSLLNVIAINEDERYVEGGLKRIETNRYERNPVNRELCLTANGYSCKICGFDFEKKYGELGHRFIHVHHIVPVSMMSEAYEIDPVKDLIPVCPNCHAMLHRRRPPLTPEELMALIQDS